MEEMPDEMCTEMTKNALIRAHLVAGDVDGALDAALEHFPEDAPRSEETSRLLRHAFGASSSMQAALSEDLLFPPAANLLPVDGVLDVRRRSVADA